MSTRKTKKTEAAPVSRPAPVSGSASSAAQVERFRQAARELETDDRPEEFERVFGRIVPPKTGGRPK